MNSKIESEVNTRALRHDFMTAQQESLGQLKEVRTLASKVRDADSKLQEAHLKLANAENAWKRHKDGRAKQLKELQEAVETFHKDARDLGQLKTELGSLNTLQNSIA
jgi:Mg2+ and Co2+ transporter CorA